MNFFNRNYVSFFLIERNNVNSALTKEFFFFVINSNNNNNNYNNLNWITEIFEEYPLRL